MTDTKLNIEANNFDHKNSLRLDFYLRPPDIVAKELIGAIIVKKLSGTDFLAGKIVETEAYLSRNDDSSHSARGRTNRNSAMFSDGGILYVYKIYGVHHCINVVTQSKGIGSAVLIRAIEPLHGIEIMKQFRNIDKIENLCKGPGNIAKAFDFNISHNFSSLLSSELFILPAKNIDLQTIEISTRIGISKSTDLPLRFYLINSEFVSGKKFNKKFPKML